MKTNISLNFGGNLCRSLDCRAVEAVLKTISVDARNFKKWGRSPTTTQNVGEGLKILGDDFMISLN